MPATIAAREWLVPPGHGLWIPGYVEHAVTTLHEGQGSAIAFAPDRCPITWTRPTGLRVGPLLRELLVHLGEAGSRDPSPPHAEALMFELLTPRPRPPRVPCRVTRGRARSPSD